MLSLFNAYFRRWKKIYIVFITLINWQAKLLLLCSCDYCQAAVFYCDTIRFYCQKQRIYIETLQFYYSSFLLLLSFCPHFLVNRYSGAPKWTVDYSYRQVIIPRKNWNKKHIKFQKYTYFIFDPTDKRCKNIVTNYQKNCERY